MRSFWLSMDEKMETFNGDQSTSISQPWGSCRSIQDGIGRDRHQGCFLSCSALRSESPEASLRDVGVGVDPDPGWNAFVRNDVGEASLEVFIEWWVLDFWS